VARSSGSVGRRGHRGSRERSRGSRGPRPTRARFRAHAYAGRKPQAIRHATAASARPRPATSRLRVAPPTAAHGGGRARPAQPGGGPARALSHFVLGVRAARRTLRERRRVLPSGGRGPGPPEAPRHPGPARPNRRLPGPARTHGRGGGGVPCRDRRDPPLSRSARRSGIAHALAGPRPGSPRGRCGDRRGPPPPGRRGACARPTLQRSATQSRARLGDRARQSLRADKSEQASRRRRARGLPRRRAGPRLRKARGDGLVRDRRALFRGPLCSAAAAASQQKPPERNGVRTDPAPAPS
jgi:hypothetical protein